MTDRRVSLVLALLGVTALVIGSGGYSAMTADRGVSVAVVSDENAYIGVETNDPELESPSQEGDDSSYEDIVLLTVSNNVGAAPPDVTLLEIRGTDWNGTPQKVSELAVVEDEVAGETRIVAERVVCARGGSDASGEASDHSVERTGVVDITLEASLNDGNLTARLSRGVKLTCDNPDKSGSSSATERNN